MNVLVTLLLIFTDSICFALALWVTFILRYQSGLLDMELPIELRGPILIMTAGWLLLFLLRGMYRIPVALSRFDEVARIFKTAAIGVLIIFILTFERDDPEKVTRIFLVNYGVLIFLFVSFTRITIRTYHRRLRWKGIGLWNTVIAGYNDIGIRLFEQLHNFPVWGFRVVGFVDDAEEPGSKTSAPVLGKIDELPDVVQQNRIQWVLIAPSDRTEGDVLRIFDRCSNLRIRFMIVADYYQMVIGLVRTVGIHGLPLVEIAPQLVNFWLRIVKRAMDIVVSLVMLAILSIITPFLSILIKLDTPGPVFYRQRRIGKNGREFWLYKFRSMVKDAEKKSGAIWAAKNDPRITRVGGFLRRSHIDEIPQFLNVLLGDMSLVGPRPERRQFVEQFKNKIPLYERRLRIRPGITGWAQVRHKYDESLDDVKEKTRYDLFYIDHVSFALDMRIILATMMKVIRGEGH